MGSPILEGLLFGLLLCVLIGPVFFVIVETSISKGIKEALFVDFGVLVSDVLFVTIAYTAASDALKKTAENNTMLIIGGIIFIGFGIFNLFGKKKANTNKDPAIQVKVKSNHLLYFLKGFFLNTVNPSVLLFWLAMVVFAGSKFNNNGFHITLFFICMLGVYFMVDVLKILGARQVKHILSPLLLRRLNQITGIILGIFGIVLVVRGCFS